MAAFRVLKNFEIAGDADVRFLSPGAVYIAGDIINGLIAAEANELLARAPAGSFEPADEEAQHIQASFAVRINRKVTPSGDLKSEG